MHTLVSLSLTTAIEFWVKLATCAPVPSVSGQKLSHLPSVRGFVPGQRDPGRGIRIENA